MKSWKAVVGLGVACAACCAIPLLGVSAGVAAVGSALAACSDELLPAAMVLLVIALALGGVWWVRRRRASRRAACACPAPCAAKAP